MAYCRRCLTLGVGFALMVAAPATTARAQSDARLVAAVKLAENGLNDSARAVVRRILAATAPTDSGYPEVLYTTGVLAATDYERRVALRRVILEHSQSPWADDALLMLAQVEYANGNPGATVAHATRLVNDYPTTPLKAVGAFWGARAAGDMRDPSACRLAEAGLSAMTEDVELRNQLQFQLQRCRALAQAASDTPSKRPSPPRDSAAAASPPPPAPAPAVGPRVSKGFRVQVIAAPTRAAAESMAGRLTAAGFEATIVSETGLFKVRTQPFATRAQAQQALVKIRSALRTQPFIVADK
ncbi:MAG: hypothetical protein FJ206_02110 [Gemmatimonadetes bacterium]|nr:hypothetical protein [Gemmatimonadota bacterium]